jgi:MFS family permease
VSVRSQSCLARARTLDVLALTALLWLLAKVLRYALPPLFGTFRSTYGVSNTELGVVFSALMVGYAAMQFPSGALADRIGTVRVIVGGAVVASAASLVLFVSSTYLLLLVAVVGIGVGTGAHKTVAITLLSTVYTERTGRALGTMDTVGELGGVVAPALVVAVLAASIRWQYVFLVAALGGVVLAVAFGLRVPDRLPDDGAATNGGDGGDVAFGDYLTAFRAPRFSAFVVVAVLFSFVMNGAAAFLPLYLQSRPGVSPELAGLLYSGFFVVSFVQVATGDAGDRVGHLVLIGVLMGLAGMALVGLVVVGTGALAAGGLTLAFGIGLHGTRPCRDAYLMTVIPDGVAGGTLGVVRTAMLGAGAVAPALVGFLSDVATFDVAFGLLAGAVVLSVVVVVGLVVSG